MEVESGSKFNKEEMSKLICFSLLLAVCACEAYRVLVVFPIPAKSHGILGDGIIRHLLNAGHVVTAITAFPKKQSHPNLTEVIPESNKKIFNENTINIKAILDKEQNFANFAFILELMYNLSASTMEDPSVQKFLQDPNQKFDVILGEWMFTEIYSTLPALYDCPFLWFSTLEPHWLVLRLIDENLNPAYATDYISSAIAPYPFTTRVGQLWKQINGYVTKQTFEEQEKQLYQNIIVPILRERGKVVPAYEDLMFNVSLMLGNSHVSLGLAPKLPQSYKPIGGYHIDVNVNPLPEDLKKVLDSAKQGFVYFSMGSNLKSKDIPQNLKESFLKIFGRLKQTVIWKFEEVLPNLPKNVHILTWAPQQSILAHPNCALFITHGGLLSTTEAVHFGKPIIGIPVFADQFGNVDKAVYKGFGRRVDLSYTMDKDLEVEIHEILGNPKYAQKAKDWSFIYHHRPATPSQELIHWVEHAVVTKGAKHLRSPALLVPWYQKLYLDLVALVVAGLIVAAVLLKTILKRVLSAGKDYEKKKSL